MAASGWGGGFGTGQKVACRLLVDCVEVASFDAAQHSTVQCDPSLLAPAREEPAWAVKQSSGYSAEDQVRMGAPGAAQGMKQSSSTLDGQGKDKDSPPQDFQWIPTNLPRYLWLAHLPH